MRVIRKPEYARGLGERFGCLPATIPATLTGGIWLHAVSVGEILSSLGLLQALRRELRGTPVFVSTSTLAGRALAETKLAGLVDGVFYAPLDYRFAVRAVLRRLRPALVVVMETEIWPNLFRDARRAGARLLLVNGRISDKAWPRYRRLTGFFAAALSYVDVLLAQGPQAGERYCQLGANNVQEAGNLKYDFDPDSTSVAPEIEAWRARSGDGPVWIAASVMPGEEEAVIAAYQQLAGYRLIFVPRKPESFDETAALLAAAGIPFVRRSQLPGADAPPVLLLDSMGELAGLFRIADVVFMGGTLVDKGGHNVLEPAAFGKPIIIGPHMENFPEIAADFRAAKAWRQINSPDALAEAVRAVDDVGARGQALAVRNRGATGRALAEVRRLLPQGAPRPLWPWWRLLPLAPLTLLWKAAVAADRWRTTPKRLEKPVVSIGNLTAGGTGKTPFTLWLAAELKQRGWKPCVLMRGYKSGEEAQLYTQAGLDVAAAKDRYAAAQAHRDADVFLLDDGMQHWALARDVEIVIVDGLDPTGGGLLPLGRARESWRALERATAIIVTRRPMNFGYYARVVPSNVESPAGAFCGLGNPASFHRTLREAGVELTFFATFPDHHVYTTHEIEALLARSATLLTTEKDWHNIPAALLAKVQPVTIRLQIENADALLALVEARLRARAAAV